MSKKRRNVTLLILAALVIILLVGALLIGAPEGESEALGDVMRDGILHEDNRLRFFGLEVNPAVASAYLVTAALLVCAALLRVFAIPRFRAVPGRLQLALETLVGYFDNLARSNSPHRNRTLGAYLFAAGVYIAFGTLFELFGIQVITTEGRSIALSAPLSDINAAIAMGGMSYLFILFGGLVAAGFHGFLGGLKEFSLAISMPFRLFGALVSGLLVTELVYYTISLSIVLPVIVGVLFTALHAIIQTYVLTMLTSFYYGEVTEKPAKKDKKTKNNHADPAQSALSA